MAGLMGGGGSSSPPPKPKESGDAITVTPGPVSNDPLDAQKRAAAAAAPKDDTSLLGEERDRTQFSPTTKTWG
jgi:hypothetical protein